MKRFLCRLMIRIPSFHTSLIVEQNYKHIISNVPRKSDSIQINPLLYKTLIRVFFYNLTEPFILHDM